MTSKSMRIYWSDKMVNRGDTLGVLFGDRKETIKAVMLVINKMKSSPTLSVTKREMRFFARELETGKMGVRYSYHNFYTKLLRKLMDLGFVEKDVLVWDANRRKTAAVYQLRLQQIPKRAPPGGFVNRAWHIAKGWNDVIKQ
jgi:hypothetical protein